MAAFIRYIPSDTPALPRSITFRRKLPQDNSRRRFATRQNPVHRLLDPAFGSELLLRGLENPIVNHSVQSKVPIHQAGADVFIKHLL